MPSGLNAMANCVCGDPESDHRVTTMSVPLGTTPRIMHNIYAKLTYDSTECHCGCSTFLADIH